MGARRVRRFVRFREWASGWLGWPMNVDSTSRNFSDEARLITILYCYSRHRVIVVYDINFVCKLCLNPDWVIPDRIVILKLKLVELTDLFWVKQLTLACLLVIEESVCFDPLSPLLFCISIVRQISQHPIERFHLLLNLRLLAIILCLLSSLAAYWISRTPVAPSTGIWPYTAVGAPASVWALRIFYFL